MYKKKLGCKTSVFRFGHAKVNNISLDVGKAHSKEDVA